MASSEPATPKWIWDTLVEGCGAEFGLMVTTMIMAGCTNDYIFRYASGAISKEALDLVYAGLDWKRSEIRGEPITDHPLLHQKD